MAQVFSPAANTIARVSIVVGAALPLVLMWTLSQITRSPSNTKVGIAPPQPVPFSHMHHTAELGIDCRFCHTTVDKAGFAGVPSTDTCLTCHSQVWTNSPLLEVVRDSQDTDMPVIWNRVNFVPQFVYFNHSIHIDRGINCNTCHGPVQQMHMTYKGNPFEMAWCLECHNEPERYLYEDKDNPDLTPREQVFNLYTKIQAGAKLTRREVALRDGTPYNPSAEELAEGRRLVQERGINVKQLADCWICHR